MRIISANKLLLSKNQTLVAHAIVLDDHGVVADIVPMTEDVYERPFVLFYSGLVTPPVHEWQQGKSLSEVVGEPISKGYSGELWLWQGVDYDTLIPSDSASYRVL